MYAHYRTKFCGCKSSLLENYRKNLVNQIIVIKNPIKDIYGSNDTICNTQKCSYYSNSRINISRYYNKRNLWYEYSYYYCLSKKVFILYPSDNDRDIFKISQYL